MPVTVTGLRERIAAVERLSADTTARLKAVAGVTAERIAEAAKRNLLAQTKAVKTADSIEVIDQSDRKQFVVHVGGDPDRPENLPLWIERGTRRQQARPYLRPATDAENQRYRREMAEAATDVVTRALT